MCEGRGWGVGGGEFREIRKLYEISLIYAIWIKLCVLPAKGISCNLSRDIARKQVIFQMIKLCIKHFAKKKKKKKK